jgi:5-methylcytosine-specific restriction protein A
MSSDIYEIESAIALLLPDAKVRKLCLSVFLESLTKANTCGANKWGVYYSTDGERLRLLVGSMIVLTIHKQGVWITLDEQLLQKSREELELLNLSEDWHWDTGRWSKYTRVPSRNGYYIPSEDHLQIWPIIRRLHFAYIDKVAKKFLQLREDSQRKHTPQVLAYLRQALNQYVPEPIYEDSMLFRSNPISEIEEYHSTYQNLPETERETIVQSRIGQGRFRIEVVKYWKGCAVTNCQRIELLRASHIKPWRNSSNEDRLDVYNGLLLIPNLDVAFDNGMVSFAADGKIIISELLTEDDRFKLGIHPDMRISRIDERHGKYLAYHRKNVFKVR